MTGTVGIGEPIADFWFAYMYLLNTSTDLPGADLNTLFDRADEDSAIANLTGASGGKDDVEGFVELVIIDDDFNF